MMKGSWANKIVARLNWGAFDHASHAPQLRSCHYYLSSIAYLEDQGDVVFLHRQHPRKSDEHTDSMKPGY